MRLTTARSATLVGTALLLACAMAARPAGDVHLAGNGRPVGDDQVTLGTFDSRAVAIAYANSSGFRAEMDGLLQELQQAQAEGDEAHVAELEAYGPQLQQKLHRQGFSTAPVDDILELVRDELPAIAEEAGVDVIVSRWDVVYRRPEAATIDVTERLVRAFDVSDQGLRWALEIVEQEPIPEEELGEEH